MNRLAMAKCRTSQLAAAVVTLAAVLAGCGENDRHNGVPPAAVLNTTDDGFAGTLVKNPPLRPADVVLHDTSGTPFRLGRLPTDRITALFFGFTHCNDVCPTTMADLAAARSALPAPVARRVDVVFVTVDPRRDTPPVLESWLSRFDTSFVGLRGPLPLVHQAERSLHAMPSANEPKHRNGRYQVSHTGSVYMFGPSNKSVLYTGGTTGAQYAKDFTRLLKRS